MRVNILSKYIGILFGAIILLPFKLKPILVFLFCVFSFFLFFKKEEKENSKLIFKKIFILNLVLVAYILSLFYSSNLSRAFDYLIRSLPFLILPLSFSILSNENKKIFAHWFLMTYIITNAIYVILMIIYILHLGYLSSSNDLYYYYSYITYEFYSLSDHPIYLSTQFALAIFFLINSKFIKVIKIGLFVILITGIFFLSRKGVIFSFVIVLSFYLFQILKSKKIFLIVFGFIFLGFISSMFVPEIRMRYEEIFEKKVIYNEETSTGIRTILWKNSLELIQKKLFLGYGIGDSQDVLSKKVEENGFFKIAKKKSNCHNQYLQFLLSIGVIGLFFFFITISYYFIQFKKRGDLRATMILIFFLLLFTTESFLDRQNGIIIFTTFMSILIFIDNKKEDLV